MKHRFSRAALAAAAALALLFGVITAQPAQAYVLHSRSNHIVCSAWGGGAINLAIDYYSWTDVGGTVWVQMKGGNSIHIDTLNNTVFDPEAFIFKNVDQASIYGENSDEWGNDSTSIYKFGGLAHDHALVATIDQLSDGTGVITTTTTYQGESIGWTNTVQAFGGFLSAQPEAQDIRIFFENETWLAADNATNRAWCSVRLVATS